MGKTRGLFKKIRDNKGAFHANMGIIKDRNYMDLTEEGNGTPLQYSCLENPMDGGACQAAEEIRDEPRGWGHRPNSPDSPVRS